MLQDPNGRWGMGSGYMRPGRACVLLFVFWQMGHPATKRDTVSRILGHQTRCCNNANNFFTPKCPPTGVQCNSSIKVRRNPEVAGSTSC